MIYDLIRTLAALAATVVVYWIPIRQLQKRRWPFFMSMVILFTVPFIFFFLYIWVPLYYLQPLKGKVIDEGTGASIPGAAVFVVYKKSSEFLLYKEWIVDGREAVTDENGEFKTPSFWLVSLTKRGHPWGEVYVFKPGYTKKEIRNEDLYQYQIYDLRILRGTLARKRNCSLGDIGNLPYRDREYFTKLVNEERISLGLTPYRN